MAALPLATSFPLPAAAEARLEALLVDAEEHVVATVREEGIAPLACLAFEFTGEDDLPYPTYTGALSEPERAALLADGGKEALWFPGDWPRWDFLDPPPPSVDARIDAVRADLHAAGCDAAEGAFLCELAYRLSRLAWREHGVETTPDIACWAVEHDEGWPHETFRVAARPEVVAAYEAAGWLPLESNAYVARVLRDAGASDAAAAEIIDILSELFDAAETLAWLEDPMLGAEELGVPEREQVDLVTPLAAIRLGKADAVLALAREDFGP